MRSNRVRRLPEPGASPGVIRPAGASPHNLQHTHLQGPEKTQGGKECRRLQPSHCLHCPAHITGCFKTDVLMFWKVSMLHGKLKIRLSFMWVQRHLSDRRTKRPTFYPDTISLHCSAGKVEKLTQQTHYPFIAHISKSTQSCRWDRVCTRTNQVHFFSFLFSEHHNVTNISIGCAL